MLVTDFYFCQTVRCHKHSDGSHLEERGGLVPADTSWVTWVCELLFNPGTAIPEKKNKTGAIILHLISVKV